MPQCQSGRSSKSSKELLERALAFRGGSLRLLTEKRQLARLSVSGAVQHGFKRITFCLDRVASGSVSRPYEARIGGGTTKVRIKWRVTYREDSQFHIKIL
jgi:hypothetical protein